MKFGNLKLLDPSRPVQRFTFPSVVPLYLLDQKGLILEDKTYFLQLTAHTLFMLDVFGCSMNRLFIFDQC
jgi:hypothetical protein